MNSYKVRNWKKNSTQIINSKGQKKKKIQAN